MFKFFRRLRIKMIRENKMSQYVKYAIGEILLVVIGILIALQINSWNQSRVNRKVEKDIISSLNKDFRANKETISFHIQNVRRKIAFNKKLMSLVGASREELNEHKLDSLLYFSMGNDDIDFADNTLKNLIQTDRLNLITNDTLSDLLYQWGALKAVHQKRTNKLDVWVNENYVPYLITKISFKQIDIYSGYEWGGPSKVEPEYYDLFQEIAFENFLDNTLWNNQQLLEKGKEIDSLINKVILITETDVTR